MIEAHRLSKRFGPVQALRDVSFKIRKGTITAVLGENGAGKTTTLKILLGFLRPDSGTVIVAPGRVGYIPETPVYFTWLDGRTILELSDGQTNGNGKDPWPRILAVAADLRFDPALLRRRPASYSAGNVRKFAYLQNLVVRPDLLIVDEPFTALDPPSIKCVRNVFIELRDAGTTLLLSSHMLAEMERIADGFIVLRGGTSIAHASIKEWRLLRSARPAPDLESVFLHLTG